MLGLRPWFAFFFRAFSFFFCVRFDIGATLSEPPAGSPIGRTHAARSERAHPTSSSALQVLMIDSVGTAHRAALSHP